MRIFNFEIKKVADIKLVPPKGEVISGPISGTRQTRPTVDSIYKNLTTGTSFVTPEFYFTLIPIIRKLSWINSDLGLALNDMVQLTNTGHQIKFDQEIPSNQADTMRRYLRDVRKSWGDGVSGIDGLVNKMISQIWISGALANEWVPNNDKKSLKHVAIINPETIRFSLDKKKLRFYPYQLQDFKTGGLGTEKYVRLNENTFKYIALNGDREIPYGIPPFLTALNGLSTQGDMDTNINFIMKQLGILGFFQMLMEKPEQIEGENLEKYRGRLTTLLTEAKDKLMDGIKDGVVVGYKSDHEFDFQSTTKNLNGVADIYNQNQIKVANGLKTAPAFLGLTDAGSESAFGIIFTKMLSQLQNVQSIVSSNLEFGYSLALSLAGFKFSGLQVKFNPSTITDELKFQQSQEYKIRNVYNKYMMGIISQDMAADELGYDKPDEEEPRAPIVDTSADVKKVNDKNTSERKTDSKKKPQPRRGDRSTKPS